MGREANWPSSSESALSNAGGGRYVGDRLDFWSLAFLNSHDSRELHARVMGARTNLGV